MMRADAGTAGSATRHARQARDRRTVFIRGYRTRCSGRSCAKYILRMPAAIEARALEREYKGGLRAVDGIDLRVEPGEVYGFLGPNGAGKTTTVRMLVTLLRPTGGSATVA